MTDGMGEILLEARKNKLANIWNNLTDGDIIKVWDTVSALICRTMISQQRGIVVPGLATLTLSKISLEVGNKKELLLQRPTFVLLEKFARVHQLRGGATLTPGGEGVPVIPLNIAQVAMDAQMNRDDVESCVREVVSAMSRMVAAKHPVDLTFSGIGRLQIRDSRVKMKFFKGFVDSADGSGRLVSSMQGRPGTADSVISESGPDSTRKFQLGLRKTTLGFNSDDPVLPIIRELREGMDDNDDENFKENYHQADVMNLESENYRSAINYEKDAAEADNFPEEDLFDISEEPEREDWKTVDDNRSEILNKRSIRTPMSIPRANAVNFTSYDPARSGSHTHRPTTQKGRFDSSIQEKRIRMSAEPSDYSPEPSVRSQTSCSAEFDHGILRDRNSPAVSDVSKSSFTRSKLHIPHPPPTMNRAVHPPCNHSEEAGQELCYICHQRASYNNAVDLREERRERAAEEERRLRDYLLAKSAAEVRREQEAAQARRADMEEVALYNLQSAEVAAANQIERKEFRPSFVLRRRPVTPPKFIAQENYGRDLEHQVMVKEAAERKRKEDRDLLGRMEQARLAQELAAQRNDYLQRKAEQCEEYRRALSAQVKNKHEQISDSLTPPKEPYFGRNDTNDASIAEARRRAHLLYREQLKTVQQSKRDAILKRLEDQRREQSALRRAGTDLAVDNARRYEHILETRKSLENHWIQATEEKKKREAEERAWKKNACQSSIHEQCNRYQRCRQCKRKITNTGASSILPNTYMMT